MLRTAGLLAAAITLSIPIALIATFLLLPLWSWIEERFGLESVGHSGPAEWCFVVTYAVIAGGLSAIVLRRRSRAS